MSEGTQLPLPDPIVATKADLPPAVAAALANPDPPRRSSVPAAGYTFAVRSWGDPGARPLLLVHGVTSWSDTWWRLGPGLAASGRHVVAPDLPGHGETGGWRGRQRFVETAADLAAFVRAVGLEHPKLQVIGHSWGGMVCAALPVAGLRPERLVLLDPPAWPRLAFEEYVEQPDEHRYPSIEAARAAMRALYPTWLEREIDSKAIGLTLIDDEAAQSVVLGNGDWDAGLRSLEDPAARDVPVWYVKGETANGSMIPDAWVPRLAARVGPDHVLTIAQGAHSPQRQRAEATLVAFLRALGD